MGKKKRLDEVITVQKKKNDFVIVDIELLEDNRLSLTAKGIMIYILSKPEDYQISVQDLIENSSDSERIIRGGLDELIEHGYLKNFENNE